MSADKNWGVRDMSGFFGPEPFLAATEEDARDMWDGDASSVLVRRASKDAEWEVVA